MAQNNSRVEIDKFTESNDFGLWRIKMRAALVAQGVWRCLGLGLSEGFAIIGLIEFFYMEFPENMRSLGPSVYLCGCAISSYLSSFIASEVHRKSRVGEGSDWLSEDLNKGRLDWLYYLIGGIEVVNLGYFVVCAKWYKYRKNDDVEEDGEN